MNPNATNIPEVLIVEDNLVLSLLEERVAIKTGCKVIGKVPSGEEALACYEMLRPDFILIDINLQGEIDGIEVVNRMRENIEIPVVFVSGDSSTLLHKCNHEKGYTELVVKPFTAQKLGEAITRILKFKSKEKLSSM